MNFIQWHQIETLACLLQFNFPRIPRDIHSLVKFASWVFLQPLGHTYNPIMRNFSILNYQWIPKMTSVGFSNGAHSYHTFILKWWPPTELWSMPLAFSKCCPEPSVTLLISSQSSQCLLGNNTNSKSLTIIFNHLFLEWDCGLRLKAVLFIFIIMGLVRDSY